MLLNQYNIFWRRRTIHPISLFSTIVRFRLFSLRQCNLGLFGGISSSKCVREENERQKKGREKKRKNEEKKETKKKGGKIPRIPSRLPPPAPGQNEQRATRANDFGDWIGTHDIVSVGKYPLRLLMPNEISQLPRFARRGRKRCFASTRRGAPRFVALSRSW